MPRDLTVAGTGLRTTAATAVPFSPAFCAAVALAFAALTVLHTSASRLTGDAVRALADFARLTPPPVFAVFAATEVCRS